MRWANKGLGRQIAQRRIAVCRLLVEEESATVVVHPARTEAVDGERRITVARQPVRPRDHRTVEATASVQEDDGRKRSRSLWPGEVADEPNRLCLGPAVDVDELARRHVGAGNGHRGEQTSDQNPHGHAATLADSVSARKEYQPEIGIAPRRHTSWPAGSTLAPASSISTRRSRPRARCQSTGTECTALPQGMRATCSVTEFYYAYLGDILAVSRSHRTHAYERLDANAGVYLSTLFVSCMNSLIIHADGVSARRHRPPPRLTTARTVQSYACLPTRRVCADRAGPSRKPGSASARFPVLIRPRGRQAWMAMSILHQVLMTD